MRSPLLILILSICCNTAFDQSVISQHVKLKAEQFEENGEKYIGVYPTVNQSPTDEVGRSVLKYHRRFEYLLNNKTHFQSIYDHLYPDTIKINALYTDSISKDKDFVTYFNLLIQPLTDKNTPRQRFTRKDVLKVASRFFYCDGVREDTTVSSHICIVLNGVKEAQWDKDLTVLEAFCFEAIFENYYVKEGIRSNFVNNFVRYIKEGEKKEKSQLPNKETYLLAVRHYAFDKMEKDKDLIETLMKYYTTHQSSFSFQIQP
jgi:hypothetical protein